MISKVGALACIVGAAAAYTVKTPPLSTDWTNKVGTDPWPEYPRPQLTRPNWQSLNGIWSYANATDSLKHVPSGHLGTDVLIPSCLESALSGVMIENGADVPLRYSWFRTTFTVPSDWSDDVHISFGAVDHEATVFVNGQKAGSHVGGFTRFDIDITPFLKDENELVVHVHDPTDVEGGPAIAVGKQTVRPEHIFYTPCTGIWQQVFLESVPKHHIEHLDVSGDMHGKINVTAHAKGNQEVTVEVLDGNKVIGKGQGTSNTAIVFTAEGVSTWSPTSPKLYPIRVTLGKDVVGSYTGFRTISKGTVNGVVRPLINDEFVLAFGPLDQGYWPDGIYTPPNHEAMVYDLKVLKELGFNMVRKHIKVEMDLFYRACDEMGLLVMQDMPSMRSESHPTEDDQSRWELELFEFIKTHRSFPSIYTWVIYNEGWGQLSRGPETELTPIVRSLDPTRLINSVTGWNDHGAGDYHDNHHYSSPQCGTPFYSIASTPYDPSRIGFQGEFGGVGHNVSIEHLWNDAKAIAHINQTYETDETLDVWNYRTHAILAEFTDQVKRFACSGGVYTQTTDVEGELNGLLTYDRRLSRVDKKQWKRDLDAIYEAAAKRGGTKAYRKGWLTRLMRTFIGVWQAL